MTMDMHHPIRVTNILAYVMFTLSIFILAGVLAFTLKIDVLENWRLVLPSQPIHAGDTVTFQSLYVKKRAVAGKATRYIECKNEGSVFIRYPLNEAVADRPPGNTGTGVIVKLPTDIPNLPTSCKLSINVAYKVYPWRTVTEFASTPEFELLPPM